MEYAFFSVFDHSDLRIFQKQDLVPVIIKGDFCLEIRQSSCNLDDLPETETVVLHPLPGLQLQDRRRLELRIRSWGHHSDGRLAGRDDCPAASGCGCSGSLPWCGHLPDISRPAI